MRDLRRLIRFRLRTLLVLLAVAAAVAWWYGTRLRIQARRQSVAGRQMIHQRDRIYLESVFDQSAKDHLVTVLGDSRLTHWNRVRWIVCPNRQTMVSYGSDQALIAWNRDDGSIRRGFYDVLASTYAEGEGLFLMVTDDGKLRTWSLDEQPAVDQGQAPQVEMPKCEVLACSPCGRYLACLQYGGPQASATIWDRETKRAVVSMTKRVTAVAFSADSERVLLAEGDTIHEYDTNSGKLLSQQKQPADEAGSTAVIYAAVFTQDDQHVIVGDASGKILVYAWGEKRIVREMSGGLGTIRDLALNMTGDVARMFVASDCVRNYPLWESPDRHEAAVVLNEEASAVYGGPHGVVACVRQGRLMDMIGRTPRRMAGGPRVDATCFAFSPEGDRIALAGRDGQIVVRETAKWERVQSWRAHDAWIRQLAWSPRGDILTSMADDKVLAAWDPQTGDELRSMSVLVLGSRGITFNRTGERFARFGGGLGVAIGIVEVDTFEVTKTIPQVPLALRGNFLFSRDGSRMYAGGSMVTLNVWSLADDKLVGTCGPRTGDEVKLALSAEEDMVFTADLRDVRAFSTATRQQLWSVRAHDELIADISSHPSRPLLATGGNDGHVTIVDTHRGQVLKRLRLGPGRGEIVQVDFSPDGELLAAAMSNGAVVVLRSPWD